MNIICIITKHLLRKITFGNAFRGLVQAYIRKELVDRDLKQ